MCNSQCQAPRDLCHTGFMLKRLFDEKRVAQEEDRQPMTVMLLYNRLPKSSLAKSFTFPKSPLPKISSLPKSSLCCPSLLPLHTSVLGRVPLRADQYLFDWPIIVKRENPIFGSHFFTPDQRAVS